MLDVPSPDYGSKKNDSGKKKKKVKQKLGFGTPIKELPKSIQKQIRK